MPLPPVPREQQIRKLVIRKPRDRQHQSVAEQRRQPPLARRYLPHRNRDLRADDQSAEFIGRMKAAAHIVKRSALGGKCFGFVVDVAK